jgi:hypothetical protein
MKKPIIAALSLSLAFCIYLSGCEDNSYKATSANNSSSSANSSISLAVTSSYDPSSPYIIQSVVNPVTVDESSAYTTTELTALNKLNKAKFIGSLFFLDNNTIIYSAQNGKKIDNDFDTDYDLYKYNLTTDVLTHICSGIRNFNSVTIKDINNFSLSNGNNYFKIENNKLTASHYFLKEGEKSGHNTIGDAFYNEQTGKLLFSESGKTGTITGTYVSDINFSSPQKLPFSRIYRVQWLDNTHVLVGYKDGDKSLLAKYGLNDKTTIVTTLPDKNFFIDPSACNNGIIEFMYLETQSEERPIGFLYPESGTISRVSFTDCIPSSLLNNGRMVSYTNVPWGSSEKSKLNLYDTATNTNTLRGDFPNYPGSNAVSPDGSTIVFSSYTNVNNNVVDKFYINKKA